ncbi:MAG: LamG domain-containing protein [Firmicutes bacterium]|nr:LamG domain-containing protein [Bacillota bacterium]
MAVTRDRGNLIFYINAKHSGMWAGLTDQVFKDGGPSDFCLIGAKGDGTSFFSGSIDEVRIYNSQKDSTFLESLALWDIN